jgi:membrane protease YdiL (CAAX protease family)
MTAFSLGAGGARAWLGAAVIRPLLAAAGLAVVVTARWAVWRSSAVDPIAVGALFGAALLGLGLGAGWRPGPWPGTRRVARALVLGALAGVALAASALVGPHPTGSGVYAAEVPVAPWVAATVLVACAEEVMLRGALLDGLASPLGLPVAVVLTSLLFAVMHVPVYGPQALPLDLGVGFLLAGLRLVSGGIIAPAAAHAIADLAVAVL